MIAFKSSLPENSLLYKHPDVVHYKDSFAANIPGTQPVSIEQTGSAFFASSPSWVKKLMHIRDSIVRRMGLKTTSHRKNKPQLAFVPGEKAGIFNILDKNDWELILGEDDKHLNFRVSLYLQPPESAPQQLVCTTTVHYNNAWGRLYFFFVKPFHRLIVPAILKNTVYQLRLMKA